MSILGRRRLNGLPMGTIAAVGAAPSQVINLVVSGATQTTLAITFSASAGAAPITYSGFVSVHGSGTWSQNSGSIGATGGTLSGLSPNTSYDLRIVATNAYGSSTTDLLTGTVTSSSPTATSFKVSLSQVSGPAGTAVVMTVAPITGSWPSAETVTPSTSGLVGSFDNSSLVGSGNAGLTFTFTPASGPGTTGALTASAAGMTNISGPQAYTVSAVTTTSTANRFDMVVGSSAAAIGSAVQVTIYPNAKFPSGKIVLSGTNGSFSSSPTISLTSGSTTPVTVTYTPASGGEHAISATNTAGLYNPYPAPLTVFSSAAGTSRSIAVALTRSDMVTFQRDAPSGNPSGFSMPWAKGWGEVWFNVAALAGASAGLWVRLYDAMSSGASPSPATGTALHASPVQVYGQITATGIVRVLLPAGPYIYYADVATDSAFTNPVRIIQRFRVGVVIGHFSRSQESGLSRAYAYSQNVPLPTSYAKTASWVTFDYRYSDNDSGWFVHDGVTIDPYQYHYSESTSSGAQEMGRLIESQLGVCVGITGSSATGGGLDVMVNHDGSLTSGFTGTVAASVGNKFRYFWMATGNWEGVDSTNFPNETHAEVRTRFFGAVDYIGRTYPSCAVIGWVAGASGIFGSDGSSLLGYTRNQSILLNEIEPANPMVVSKECYNWNEFYSGHSTMAARVHYVRAGFRQLMAAELSGFGGYQTTSRGPRLATSGTIQGNGRIISIPYTLSAGSSLLAVGINYNNPAFAISSATNTELASLFSVFQSGGYQGNGKAIQIDSAAINSAAGTIDLTLSGSSGITFVDSTTAASPNSFTVHYAADFGLSNSSITPSYTGSATRAVMIADDRIDTTNGIAYGWHMRPALDIAISAV